MSPRLRAAAAFALAGVVLAGQACLWYNLERRLDPVNADFLSKVRYIISERGAPRVPPRPGRGEAEVHRRILGPPQSRSVLAGERVQDRVFPADRGGGQAVPERRPAGLD